MEPHPISLLSSMITAPICGYLIFLLLLGINEGILPDVDPDYFCSVIQSVSEGIAFTFVRGKMSNKDISDAVKFCTNFIVNGIRSV